MTTCSTSPRLVRRACFVLVIVALQDVTLKKAECQVEFPGGMGYLRVRQNRKIRIWVAIPDEVSSTTSCHRPVREGRKLWCHSSRLATNAVPSTASADQRNVQRGWPGVGSVTRQARNKRKLSRP